jgi:predicted Zn-dependent protease
MDGAPDSLQTAIAAYNSTDYQKALLLFNALQISHPGNSEEKKYAGLCYLVTKSYDKALQQFDELHNMPNVFSNEGDFLKAVTLLQRGAPGDELQAKQLLQRVVNENEEGSATAKTWLKIF